MVSRERIRAHKRAREEFWERHDRDGYQCPSCGDGEAIEVHHRDGDPFNNNSDNLLGLCHSCHRWEHHQRNTDRRLETMESEFDAVANGDESAFDSEASHTGYGSAH